MNSHRRGSLSRRGFVQATAAVAGLLGGIHSTAGIAKGETPADDAPVCPHKFLTPVDNFNTVARGSPKPHTLMGEALAAARMTPDTWRLEITADPFVEPPNIRVPATIAKSFTIVDGTALDLPKLIDLGKQHGVKFVKALQCLNIQTPLGQGLWEGVPLRNVLELCGKMENVRRIYYRGFHNNDPTQIFQSSVSFAQAMETAPGELPVFLAYRLNGEDLQPLRGGPVRMIVPWAHGFKSIKWLQQIFLTNDYRTNDTYATQNNDPESYLKSAAYTDSVPEKIKAGAPLTIFGQVIAGLSGVERVESWLRPVTDDSPQLADDAPELLAAEWKPCQLLPPPNWKSILPDGMATKDLLGFDKSTGEPLTWPLRWGVGSWMTTLRGLAPGRYEFRARAVDRNGFAQPEPRPQQKSGQNALQVKKFEVVTE